ncbi:MAG TPA: ribosome silencing factor [Candidatus Methanoperedens sp.]|nr:ribosome silencing factor [Candidatus Methanoperedens sp.]
MATVRNLVRIAMRAAQEKKGQDVLALDVRGLSSVTDYMVVCTGSSDTNVRAIAEGVQEKLAAQGERPLSVEGTREGTWILIDYVDFVVHVFHAEKRLFFGIEELWADAKQIPLAEVPPKAPGRVAGRPAAATAGGVAAKEALPPLRRTALKPAAKKSAVPKKSAAKRPAPKRAAVPKRKAQD